MKLEIGHKEGGVSDLEYFSLLYVFFWNTGWQLKNGHLEMWMQPKIGVLDQNPLTTTIVLYICRNDHIQ